MSDEVKEEVVEEEEKPQKIKPSFAVLHELRKSRIEQDCSDKNKTFLAREIENGENEEVTYFLPFSSIALNKELGGGIPNGVSEIFSDEGQLKSHLAADVIKNAQRHKLPFVTVLVETEGSIRKDNIQLFANIGVDLDNLLIKKTKIVEDAFEYLDEVVTTSYQMGYRTLCVIDSLGHMSSKREKEVAGYDAKVGGLERSKTINYCIRLFTETMERCDSTLLVVNHSHDKITIGFSGHGPPKKESPGGKFLKFTCRMRMIPKKIEKIKSGDKFLGYKVKVSTIKNKLKTDSNSKGKDVIIPIRPGKGILVYKELCDLGLETGILKKKGNVIHYGDKALGVGIKAEFELAKPVNKKLFSEIKKKVVAALKEEKE